jgi:hypothetical protein
MLLVVLIITVPGVLVSQRRTLEARSKRYASHSMATTLLHRQTKTTTDIVLSDGKPVVKRQNADAPVSCVP